MAVIGILLAIAIAYLVHCAYERWQHYQIGKKIGVPHDPPGFFLGSFTQVSAYVQKYGVERMPFFHLEQFKKHGENFIIFNAAILAQINTRNLEVIRNVFIKQFSKFVDREDVHPFFGNFPMGESLLQVGKTGPHDYGWKAIRSVASPAFTTGKMKQMFPVIHERCLKLISVLKEKATSGVVFDIYDEFQALTLDVIGRTAFGTNADSLSDRNDHFYTASRKYVGSMDYRESFAIKIGFIFPSIFPFIVAFDKLYWIQRGLINDLRKVLSYRKQHADEARKVDLIQLMLKEDEERQIRENKPAMREDTIISNCFGFLIAGYETTSTALAYTSWLLAQHPEVQSTLHNEIVEAFDAEDEVDYDTAMKLPYLNTVYKESLRLKPPVVTFCARTALEDVTIGDLHIPRGVSVSAPVHCIHWDEKHWPDPFKFDPTRFTDGKQHDPLTWIPFGIGPRMCAGMRFAEMELKLTLVELIRKYEILPDPSNTDSDLKSTLSTVLLRPVDGVKVVLKNRS
uniref:Cytochrome P450 n=1 Tax=Panagrellus redivivus TaxID=6233 RepID=A0A7E4VVQ3_PANRE